MDQLARVVKGWKKIKDRSGKEMTCNRKNMELALNEKEIIELMQAVLAANGLEPDDLKKFVSPPESDAENSAKDATPGNARSGPK